MAARSLSGGSGSSAGAGGWRWRLFTPKQRRKSESGLSARLGAPSPGLEVAERGAEPARLTSRASATAPGLEAAEAAASSRGQGSWRHSTPPLAAAGKAAGDSQQQLQLRALEQELLWEEALGARLLAAPRVGERFQLAARAPRSEAPPPLEGPEPKASLCDQLPSPPPPPLQPSRPRGRGRRGQQRSRLQSGQLAARAESPAPAARGAGGRASACSGRRRRFGKSRAAREAQAKGADVAHCGCQRAARQREGARGGLRSSLSARPLGARELQAALGAGGGAASRAALAHQFENSDNGL